MVKILTVLLFFVFSVPLSTQSLIGDTGRLLEPVIEDFLNGKIGRSLAQMYDLEKEIEGYNGKNWEIDYRLLRLDLWRARIYLSGKDKRQGERQLNNVIERAERFAEITRNLELDDRIVAEAYRIEADARGELMLHKGVAYIIQNGSRVQNLAEKAAEIDEFNVDAVILKALGKINAPPIFGGNREEGLAILMKLWDNRSLYVSSRVFKIAVSLGDAYKENAPEKARNYYEQAASLYPGNRTVQKRIEEL